MVASLVNFEEIVLQLFGSRLLPASLALLLLPTLLWCQSKKKFETDGRAQLVPRPPTPTTKDDSLSHVQVAPTAQNPPANTPLERSSDFEQEQDTLANVKSLPPEKSEAPISDKKNVCRKKGKKEK